MANKKHFQSLLEVYQALQDTNDSQSQDAHTFLALRDWFIGVSEFDSLTGLPLPIGLAQLTENTSIQSTQTSRLNSRLHHIVTHCTDAIDAIIRNTRQTVIKERTMVPIYAAREVDSNTVAWLSRQSGRNLREKLAGKPYIKAPKRQMSLDCAENRLLKVLLLKFEQLLFEIDALNHEALLLKIQHWLRQEPVKLIAAWQNLPPNNTLLQDKYYRKLWDAWIWLQRLDEDTYIDHKRLDKDWLVCLYWYILAKFNGIKAIRFIEQPLMFDYQNFMIDFNGKLTTVGRYYDDQNKAIKLTLTIKAHAIEVRYGQAAYVISKNHQGWQLTTQLNNQVKTLHSGNQHWLAIEAFTEKVVNEVIGQMEVLSDESKSLLATNNVEALAIDLYAARPKFSLNSKTTQSLPFRLLIQYWPIQQGKDITLDCAKAKAIKLTSDITTVSMFSLFNNTNEQIETHKLQQVAQAFAQQLKHYFNCQHLCYLVPDHISDFELANIRTRLNYSFDKAQPIPRSIGAIIQSVKQGNLNGVNYQSGDTILVLSQGAEALHITSIIGKYDGKLKKCLPQSSGICWERHPTISFSAGGNVHGLSPKLLPYFAINDLLEERSQLSWVDDKGQWYSINTPLKSKLLPDKSQLDKAISAIVGGKKTNQVFLLGLDNRFDTSKQIGGYQWLKPTNSPTQGAQSLIQWQQQAEGISIWRDHLPQLAIKVDNNGVLSLLHLVKNQTVTARIGKEIPIPITQTFTLPAKQKEYRFALKQGQGGKLLHYQACLNSAFFPLEKDTECQLQLSYCYGADNPYQLIFKNINPIAGEFQFVVVDWQEIDEANAKVPGFPEKESWSQLQNYPSTKGKEPEKLLDWIEQNFSEFEDYLGYISGETYCKPRFDISQRLQKSIRFPVFTVWNFGRHLEDENTPETFKRKAKQGIAIMVQLLKHSEIKTEIKQQLFFVLSCLHKDAPIQVSNKLLGYVKNEKSLEQYRRSIAFSIGDASEDWQQTILQNVLELNVKLPKATSICLEILAVACWREQKLVAQLSHEQVEQICRVLIKQLLYGLEQIKVQNRLSWTTVITRQLELLLALLRLRGSSNAPIAKIFALRSMVVHQFVDFIEKFTQVVIQKRLSLRSRVQLQIEKPQRFNKVPDLLYALNLYLTGDSGAGAVVVTGVDEEG